MVKPDVQRNYYADLEIPNDASLEDIKKQYRKLALKYHPDRNPGKEAECISKFQAIQAAHEILGDQASRTKYDADRRRAGLYPTFGNKPDVPPRHNPYTSAPSAYPPPPRRTQAPPASSWRNTTAGGTGADRFNNFPRPAPTAKKPDHSNVFNAWNRMNPGKTQPQDAQTPNAQQRGTTSPQRPASQARPAPPPRPDTRYPSEEDIRAGTNYRTTPAGGFSDANARSAWAQFNASNAGKPGLSRSNTGRSSNKAGFDPMSGGDEGPAASTANYSKTRTRSDDARSFPPPPPPFPGPPPGPSPQRPSSYTTRTSADNVPYTEDIRPKTPYSSHIGQQRYSSSENLRRSQSTRDNTNLDPGLANTGRHRSSSPPKRGKTQTSYVVSDDSTDSDSSSSTAGNNSKGPQANGKRVPETQEDNPFLRTTDRPKKTPAPPSRYFRNGSPFTAPGDTASFDSNKADVGTGSTTDESKGKSTIFTFPAMAETLNATTDAQSRSEENINTAFSSTQWAGTFSSNNVFAAPPPAAARRPSSPVRRSSRNVRPQTAPADSAVPKTGFTGDEEPRWATPPPEMDSTTQPTSPLAANPVKFSADEWAKTMKDASWTFDPETARTASPSKSRPVSRGPSTVRKGSKSSLKPSVTAKPGSVDAVEEEPAAGNTATTTDAMDIDMSDPPLSPISATKPARVYPVVPDRPARSSNLTTSPPLKTNLADLHTALNGSTNDTGLEGLPTISSSLPFESKASTTNPLKSFVPQLLQLPTVPRAPDTPTKLTKSSWSAYCTAMSSYLDKYDRFDTQMLDHFTRRRAGRARLVRDGVRALEAVGESSGGHGFLSYAQGVKEDERVREVWGIAAEKHGEAVRVFEGVRERVRVLSEGAGLSDV